MTTDEEAFAEEQAWERACEKDIVRITERMVKLDLITERGHASEDLIMFAQDSAEYNSKPYSEFIQKERNLCIVIYKRIAEFYMNDSNQERLRKFHNLTIKDKAELHVMARIAMGLLQIENLRR